MIVIANAFPLIALSKVEKLELLRDIFGEITIPQGVYNEVVVRGAGKPGAGKVRGSVLDTHRAGAQSSDG